MKSNSLIRQGIAWVLLFSLLALSGILLYMTERSYGAFREALQQIQLEIRLVDYRQENLTQARLQFSLIVKMPPVEVPTWLELLDWYLKSADGSVHLGFYTMGEKRVELVSGQSVEVSLEAIVEGPNFEKLQQLQASSGAPVSLLFQGISRIMFRLPQDEERRKLPVEQIVQLNREGE